MIERNICKRHEAENIAMVDILPDEGSCIYKTPINIKDVFSGLRLNHKIFPGLNPEKGFSLAMLLLTCNV